MASLVWATLAWLLRPAVNLISTSEASSSVKDLLELSQAAETHSTELSRGLPATESIGVHHSQPLALSTARLAPLTPTTDDLLQSDSGCETASKDLIAEADRNYSRSEFAPVPSLSKLPPELLR